MLTDTSSQTQPQPLTHVRPKLLSASSSTHIKMASMTSQSDKERLGMCGDGQMETFSRLQQHSTSGRTPLAEVYKKRKLSIIWITKITKELQ